MLDPTKGAEAVAKELLGEIERCDFLIEAKPPRWSGSAVVNKQEITLKKITTALIAFATQHVAQATIAEKDQWHKAGYEDGQRQAQREMGAQAISLEALATFATQALSSQITQANQELRDQIAYMANTAHQACHHAEGEATVGWQECPRPFCRSAIELIRRHAQEKQ